MKKITLIFLILLFFWPGNQGSNAATLPPENPSSLVWPSSLPVYDHIVVIIEENKDYDEIIGNTKAPYINNVLKKEGANFTKMFGEEHHSQGNYFWLFSGDNQDIGFKDEVPSKKKNPGYPFKAANLGEQLLTKGFSFKGYAENLPQIGFTGDFSKDGLYARKHVPWISFANVPNGVTAAESSNLRFTDFPSDPSQFANLPTVAFVIPNLANDMHNGRVSKSIPAGDNWLQKNINTYYQWAKTHNSLLILTFDENDDQSHYLGLTNPSLDIRSCSERGNSRRRCIDLQNRIVTIFAGAHIRPGDYSEGKGITHVNILRTIEAMFGLSKAGAQQENAAKGRISDDFIITDVFETVR